MAALVVAVVSCLTLCAPICAVEPEPKREPSAALDDFDDVEVEVQRENAEQAWQPNGFQVEYFDQVVFSGSRTGSAAEVRRELAHYLREKIVAVDLVCQLTDGQKQKLQLAGRGDIERLLNRVAEQRRQLQPHDNDERRAIPQNFQLEAEAMRDAVRSDPFDDGSLFAKTRTLTLTAAQRARFRTFSDSDRLTGIELHSRPDGADASAEEIKEIRFPATEFDDIDMARLQGLQALQSLILDSTRITDAGLAHLSGLSNLQELGLARTQISGAGLRNFSDLTSLRMLDLRRTQVSSEALVHFRGLVNLKRLHLEFTPIGDAGAVHLAALPELSALLLGQTQIGDIGVARLNQLRNLKILGLDGTRITDTGLAAMKELQNLKTLDLDGTRITDAGLVHLIGMKNLEVLDLRNTRVTDAGMVHLGKVATLRHLYLFDTAVTDSGTAALQRALPAVRIFQ